MEIGFGKIATFHYTLKDEKGVEIETSRPGEPQAFLYGRRNIIAGLEEALEGKQAGDEVTVTLPPDKAYGPRQENAITRVPIKHLLNPPKRMRPGMVVSINTREEPKQARVTKVGKFNVDVDTNHPLAGETLQFEVEILEVREASKEELAHGHAHGPGGHHH